MHNIPAHFVQHVLDLDEVDGRAWLNRLPAILADCERRWGLTLEPPFPHLSFNYVAPAKLADGTPVIVKICSISDEFSRQAEALRLFDGHGMVRLLDVEEEEEILLLEHIQPGILLTTQKDDVAATTYAANVMRQIWRPMRGDHPFPTVADWGRGFTRLREHYAGGHGPFTKALLEEAETLFAELTATMAEPVLLHGDLHHENILAAEREPWLAIDPKGLVGEPAYELGALLRNPLPALLNEPEPGRILARRVDQLAEELHFERARVRGWGLSQAVLSAWWTVEDTDTFPPEMITCAELLAAIKV